MCNNIRNMNEQELKKYIAETREKINKLMEQYFHDYVDKIKDSEEINDISEQAVRIKNLFKYVEWVNKKMEMNQLASDKRNPIPKRGEIWTCELGQNIGSEENKIRPVIVVQNNTGNEKGPTTIVVPISNRQKKIKVHIQLRESDYRLVEGEAQKVTGTVLCEQIKVVSKVRLGRHIATLRDDFVRILDSKLKSSLELQKK